MHPCRASACTTHSKLSCAWYARTNTRLSRPPAVAPPPITPLSTSMTRGTSSWYVNCDHATGKDDMWLPSMKVGSWLASRTPKSAPAPRLSCTRFLESEKMPCTLVERVVPTVDSVPLATVVFQPSRRLPPGSRVFSSPVSKSSSPVLTTPKSCRWCEASPIVTEPMRKLCSSPRSTSVGTCSRPTTHATTPHAASLALCAARKKPSSEARHGTSPHCASAPWYSVFWGKCGHARSSSSSANGFIARLAGSCSRRSAASIPKPTTSPTRGRKRS